VKHSFIILISFLLLSPFLTSCEKYVGEYKDGKRNGQGTITWSDGKKYVGEWKNGKYNSQGTLTLPNGEKYVGEYKDGKKNGQGTFTFSDGRKGVGEFRNDRPWNIIDYDKDGKTIGRYVNGEYIEKP